MKILQKQINESIETIRKFTSTEPTIGIILGTGLGTLKEIIQSEATIPYQDIPYFPDDSLHGGDLCRKLQEKGSCLIWKISHY
jgi:purine-nucleoside phosphorylase